MADQEEEVLCTLCDRPINKGSSGSVAVSGDPMPRKTKGYRYDNYEPCCNRCLAKVINFILSVRIANDDKKK